MSATTPSAVERAPRFAYFAVFSVVLAAAYGPIVLRGAQLYGLPSLYIIAARLTLSSLVLLPICLTRYRTEYRQLTTRDWLLTMLTGAIFALNLIALLLALEYTSVLITGILRRTSGLWILLIEIAALGVVFTRNIKIGLLLTLIGTIIMTVGGATAITLGTNPLLGAGISLLGAVASAGYMVFGRMLREKLPFLAYSLVLFVSADIVVIIFALVRGVPFTGYDSTAYLWIIAVTIVTQFFGHLAISVSVRHFDATYISLMMNGSILLSGVIAYFQFGEVPAALQFVGLVLVLVGVVLANKK